MSENYEDYLEGQYEGNIVQRYKQMKDDEQEAIAIAEDVKKVQEVAKENAARRILNQEEITQADIDKVLEDYTSDEDKYAEYLVSGAILQCDQATMADFILPNGKSIILDSGGEKEGKERLQTTLRVLENPMSANGLIYATVSDTKKNVNIFPFACNCSKVADREDEIREITADENCSKHGVCRHLMRLNEEWENISFEGSSYMSKIDINMPRHISDGYLQAVRNGAVEDASIAVEKEGIMMTSILFCKHGGIITPVNSGQTFFSITMDVALQYMELYLEGNLCEEDVLIYIQYVAQNCELEIATIGSGGLQGADIERNFDDYILAWSYYWNVKIDEGVFGEEKVYIRPDVVKAMIMDESSWGSPGAKNSSRDVMQCLVPGDYALWLLSGYNPLDTMDNGSFRYHMGTNEEVVWIKDGAEYKQGSMRTEFCYYKDEVKKITTTSEMGFGDGLGILANIITIIDSSEDELKEFAGEYLIHYDEETVNMSIACGTAYLAYNMGKMGNEMAGVRQYNGGGKEEITGEADAYVKSINENLSLLVHEEYIVEALNNEKN